MRRSGPARDAAIGIGVFIALALIYAFVDDAFIHDIIIKTCIFSIFALSLNLLIGSERARAERYRNTLDNLAHSLKTPLAAIRTVLSEQDSSEMTERVETQIERKYDPEGRLKDLYQKCVLRL